MVVTLANGAGGAEVPTNPLLVAFKTAGGVLKSALPASGSVAKAYEGPEPPKPCDPQLSLSAGATLQCALVVTFEGDTEPSELVYRTPAVLAGTPGDARTASAPLRPKPCSDCGTVCSDLEADRFHCGSCTTALPEAGGAACVAGKPACPAAKPDFCPGAASSSSSSGAYCTTFASDPLNCGGCGVVSPSGSCVAGVPFCPNPRETYCAPPKPGDSGDCANLKTSSNHCGACWRKVGAGSCTDGAPVCAADAIACGEACVFSNTVENCGECGKRCGRGDCAKWGRETARTCIARINTIQGDGTCQRACIREGFERCLDVEWRDATCFDTLEYYGITCACGSKPR